MKKILTVTGMVLFTNFTFSQKLPSEFKSCFNRCDSQTVFLAIVQAKKLEKVFPKEVFEKYYSRKEHIFLVERNLKQAFFKDINRYYQWANNKNSVLQIIRRWCYHNSYLDKLGNLNPEFPPEAILFYTKETKTLFSKFNFIPKKREWYSLSTYELYELNLDFLNYVENLSSRERRILLIDLKKTSMAHR